MVLDHGHPAAVQLTLYVRVVAVIEEERQRRLEGTGDLGRVDIELEIARDEADDRRNGESRDRRHRPPGKLICPAWVLSSADRSVSSTVTSPGP